MKPCPPCKYSPMCIVMGFDNFVGEVIMGHLKDATLSWSGSMPADRIAAEMLQAKANEIVERMMAGVPAGCPGRPEAKSAEVQVMQSTKDTGELDVDIRIAVPKAVRKIKTRVVGPSEET